MEAAILARRLLGITALAFLCARPTSGAPLFPAPQFPADAQMRDLISGDFNGDSSLDLMAASPYPGVLTLYPGLGDGTFGPKSTIPVPRPLLKLLSTDRDGDGIADIVGLHASSIGYDSSVDILLGNGDGTFHSGPSVFLTNSNAPWGLALGDLNEDGVDDLVVVSDGPLFILLGRTDGSFAPPTQYPAISGRSVVIGRFNQDGHADVAIGTGGMVRVLLGLGNGALGPETTISVGWDNGDIEAADFDNDGDLDLVASSFSNNPYPWGNLNVLLGNGSGGFSLFGTYGTTGDGAAVSAVDLDRDGRVDLAAVGRGRLEVFMGLGGGLFSPKREYGVGYDAEALTAADLNGDGLPDLAAADCCYTVTAFVNDGSGRFGQERFGSYGGGGRLATGDFNEDGRPDIAAADRFMNQVVILLADGPGSFEAERRSAAGPSPGAIAVGDFNADQHQDLAVASFIYDPKVTILLGRGDGTFTTGVTLSAGEAHGALAVGDFNGDGIQDIAAINDGNDTLVVWFGEGDGSFRGGWRFACGRGPIDLAVANIDGDEFQDLVVVSGGLESTYNDKIALLRGIGSDNFAAPTFIPLGGQLQSVAIGDFNADSIQDIAVADAGTFGNNSNVSVLLGLGGGSFAPRISYPAFFPSSVVVGDFDGDQIQDVAALAGSALPTVSVLRGTGAGTLAPAEMFATTGGFSYGPYDLVTADFNGDGRRDLALASDLATATLLLSHGSVPANRPPAAAAGSDLVAECSSPAGRAVTLDGSASSDPDSSPGTHDDIVSFEWFENFGTPSQALLGAGETLSRMLSLGVHAVTLVVTDAGGLTATDDLLVSVADTTPPTLLVALDPPVLWPPNHRMVQVTATVTAIDACGPASFSLLSVSSSEPDDAPGGADGSTTNDIQEVTVGGPDVEFLLRAERATGGPGRTYTATYRTVDGSQNARAAASTAFVPHDQSGVTDPLTLTARATPAGTLLEWPGVPGAAIYRAIRGPLERLVSMGHDPSAAPAACLASGLTVTDTTGFEDAAVPAVGHAIFYLVEYDDGRPTGYGSQPTFWDRTEAVGRPCP